MIQEISINNFKNFSEEQSIPIKPITLIYGTNSSGKSSILQAILMMKQTIEDSTKPDVALLPKGNITDLGNFKEFINKHDSNKIFAIKYIFKTQKNRKFFRSFASKNIKISQIGIEFEFHAEITEVLVKKINILIDDEVICSLIPDKELPRLAGEQISILPFYYYYYLTLYRISDINWESKILKNLCDLFKKEIECSYTKEKLNKTLEELNKNKKQKEKEVKEEKNNKEYELTNLKKYQEKLKDFDNNKRQYDDIREKFDIKLDNYAKLNTIDEEKGFELNKEENLALKKQIKQLKKELQEIEKQIVEFKEKMQDTEDEYTKIEYKINELEEKIKPLRIIENIIKVTQEDIEYFNGLLKVIENDDFTTFQNEYQTLSKSIPYELKNFIPVISKFLLPKQFNAKYYERYNIINLFEIIQSLSEMVDTFIKKIVYIGPLREKPSRVYNFDGNLYDYVGHSGKMVPNILFKNSNIIDALNDFFENIKLGYKFEIAKYQEKERNILDTFSLRLIDNLGTPISILDVGFGISQILPILVQNLISNNKILLIEQPEIHLHPKLQAELGEFFAKSIAKGNNNSFIIETHSENIILRLQKLIRKGELNKDQVSVIYVDKTEDGSVCYNIRLDDNGDFKDKWPHGFFEESFNEMFD